MTTDEPPIAAEDAAKIDDNWRRVVDEVRDAEARSGRPAGSVTIVGVTKYVGTPETLALVRAGCHHLGENRPQALWRKNEEFDFASAGVQWHLIGHLQRNKVRRSVTYSPLIHSVDSQRLARAIDDAAVAGELGVDALIELNISDEAAKTGLPVGEIEGVLTSLADASHARSAAGGLRIRGLMGMASGDGEALTARVQFARLRELRDRVAREHDLELPELSMGMSGDFDAAIAEGATMVRIGSRIFQGVRRQ